MMHGTTNIKKKTINKLQETKGNFLCIIIHHVKNSFKYSNISSDPYFITIVCLFKADFFSSGNTKQKFEFGYV